MKKHAKPCLRVLLAPTLPALALALLVVSQSASAQLSYTMQSYKFDASIQGSYPDPAEQPNLVMVPVNLSELTQGDEVASASATRSLVIPSNALLQGKADNSASSTLAGDGFSFQLFGQSSTTLSGDTEGRSVALISAATYYELGVNVSQAGDYVLNITGERFYGSALGVYGSVNYSMAMQDPDGQLLILADELEAPQQVLSLKAGAYRFNAWAGGSLELEGRQTTAFDGYTSGQFSTLLTVSLQAVQPVPEPATYALMGLGLLAVGAQIRRQRRPGA